MQSEVDCRNSNSKSNIKQSRVTKSQKRDVVFKIKSGEYKLKDWTGPSGPRESPIRTHYKRVHFANKKNDEGEELLVTVCDRQGVSKTTFVSCKYCGELYAFSGSTTHPMNHVKNKCVSCMSSRFAILEFYSSFEN